MVVQKEEKISELWGFKPLGLWHKIFLITDNATLSSSKVESINNLKRQKCRGRSKEDQRRKQMEGTGDAQMEKVQEDMMEVSAALKTEN